MTVRSQTLAVLVLGGLLAGTVRAAPWPMPPYKGGPAPLLYVRFTGPQDMRLTFYQGEPTGYRIPTPAVVGLRPGYVQRMKLDNMRRYPGVVLYPTIEV